MFLFSGDQVQVSTLVNPKCEKKNSSLPSFTKVDVICRILPSTCHNCTENTILGIRKATFIA